jgi:hypothetical protein
MIQYDISFEIRWELRDDNLILIRLGTKEAISVERRVVVFYSFSTIVCTKVRLYDKWFVGER